LRSAWALSIIPQSAIFGSIIVKVICQSLQLPNPVPIIACPRVRLSSASARKSWRHLCVRWFVFSDPFETAHKITLLHDRCWMVCHNMPGYHRSRKGPKRPVLCCGSKRGHTRGQSWSSDSCPETVISVRGGVPCTPSFDSGLAGSRIKVERRLCWFYLINALLSRRRRLRASYGVKAIFRNERGSCHQENHRGSGKKALPNTSKRTSVLATLSPRQPRHRFCRI
jgi:hypothetical protein